MEGECKGWMGCGLWISEVVEVLEVSQCTLEWIGSLGKVLLGKLKLALYNLPYDVLTHVLMN